MTRLSFLSLLFGLLVGPFASAQPTPLALTGARVYPVSGPMIERATVLIVDGKIAAVGPNVTVPANARRIDLHGAALLPGLIDARSALFLSAEDQAGAGSPDQDMLDAADFFDQDAARVLAQGVTTLYLAPSARGSVSGTGAIVKLHRPTEGGGATWAEPLKPRAALHLALGLSANGRSTSLERLSSYEALRTLLKGGQQYQKSFDRYALDLQAYEKRQKQGASQPPVEAAQPGAAPQGSGGAPTAASAKPTKPRTVPAQEILLSALKREIPVRIEAHRADDILNALRLAEEFHLKLILEAPTESGAFAGEIARRGVQVVWGPTLSEGPPRLDTLRDAPETPALLAKAGVTFALTPNTRVGLASRFLRENAALAVGQGVSPEQALRSITLDAARLLGIADRVGSIQVGKDADLIVLTADPWNPAAQVAHVFINGSEVYTAK